MAPTFIIHGPQGDGKSQHAEDLAAHFGCSTIVDEWTTDQPVVSGALHLTQEVDQDWHWKPLKRDAPNVVITIMPLHRALQLMRAGLQPSVLTSSASD
jgi:hypothetical protein